MPRTQTRDYGWLIFLILFVLGGLWGTASRASDAQPPACADPFAGEQQLHFNPDLWPRTDFCQHNIPYREIRSGGPPPDGIPPIDAPRFETVAEARAWLTGRSPVIALQIAGEARAYPLAILMWHEIVNDTVGGIPVAVTFCPLCNSAIVFDRRVGGQTLNFGTTGNLRNSDLIMWDRQTQSWWQQFTGEGIVGTYTGQQLVMLPSQVVGFASFSTQFPEGQVLSLETGFGRSYGITPYAYYDTEGTPLFAGVEALAEVETRLPLTSRVLAGIVEGEAVAYPFTTLSRETAVNDMVGSTPVVALWQVGVASPLDTPRIDQGREIGTAALYHRVLGGQTLTFSATAAGRITDNQTSSTWNAFGMATEGPLAGSQLRQIPAAGHFWFAWIIFQPKTTLYRVE